MPRVDLLDGLFDARVLVAMGIYAALIALELPLEYRLVRLCEDNPPALWFAEHLGAPLLRAACIVVFIYLAYPALFGLREAPTLTTLLAAHSGATSTLLGVAFLVALFAPIVPGLHRHPEFVLPVQGMLAAAVLFHWLTDWLHITSVSPWPGSDVIALICVGVWALHRLARRIGQTIGRTADAACETAGYEALAAYTLTMVAQLPIVLLYSRALAAQIAI